MKLIANKSMRYKTRRLQAGDEFDAKQQHARIYVGARLARYAPDQDDAELPKPVLAPPEKKTEAAQAREDEEIERLRAQAERLGIHVDGRWGVNRLQQEIAQAKR